MELTFQDFKVRASDNSLTRREKVGFPESYRNGIEEFIVNDICNKLDITNNSNQNILDLGCGCSELVDVFIEFSIANNKNLYLIDSEEMLSQITTENIESDRVHKFSGKFPDMELPQVKFDAIVAYSVLPIVFLDQSIYQFIHSCLDMLNPKGRLLLGDLPNISKRTRFVSSDEGKKFVSNNLSDNEKVNYVVEGKERMDDSVVMSILSRFRNFGYETYLLPQDSRLPFANRREDILIVNY
jgi:cyclopropane fatty-acyl-phospholipid synthase-like methyltransferase